MFEKIKLGRFKDFLHTKQGKAVALGGLAAVVLLVAAVAYVSLSAPAVTASGSKANQIEAAAAQPVVVATDPPEAPVAVEGYKQEQFRDPFKTIETSATVGIVPGQTNPTMLAQGPQNGSQPAQQAGGQPPAGQDPGTPAPPPSQSQTLTLLSITFKDGERVANVTLNGVEYTARVGEQIGGSSFQVVEVGDQTVTFLYGDDRIVLAEGQSITK
ncbi:MAG: hypothetical protein ACYC1U_00655 [Candidatus Aquicultorales bacterium]